MTASQFLRRLLPWVVTVLLSLAVAWGAIELASVSAEQNYKSALETEVRRRALVLDGITLNSNVMGSVAALGLINQTAKGVARGVTPLDHPSIMETLQAIGESYRANGVYLVASNGIVQSCWYTIGVTLTGVDVKFRPYFQIAMNGTQNVYAAIGTTTSERALYFAAPLYDEATARSSIIGAAVARLDAGRIDALLSAWTSGPALLLSPQGLTYASNRAELNERLAVEPTAKQLKAIRELKQFGKRFDNAAPGTLPFDIGRETASFENGRYAVARAPVQWNDPSGEWKLVLMGDLDESMPAGRRAAIGAASGALALVLGSLFLVWRRRLARANAQRESAQAELKANAGRLESDSADKSYLAGLSDDLHRATSSAEFARKFMFHVAPRVAAEYGVFYVPGDDRRLLIPVGSHGASAGELEKVAIGQGLVGQCAKDLAPIVISDCRDTPLRIVWGAGSIAPKSILLLPVVQAGRLMGVILLASLREMAADKRALLDAMLPMVAMNLEIMERNLATQRQSELLQGQQARLKETEAWYRGIVESAPDGMLVVDDRGVIVLANPRAESMFGYGAGSLAGQEIEILVPAATRAAHPALREAYLRSGVTRPMGVLNKELRGVRRDGTEFAVEIGLATLPALGGRGVCACASVRDITERARVERALDDSMEQLQVRTRELAESEVYFRTIFENSGSGIVSRNKDGTRFRANKTYLDFIGYSEEELRAVETLSLMHPEDRGAARENLARLRSGEIASFRLQRRYLRKDGGMRWADVVVSAIRDAENSYSGSVTIVNDITEAKQADEATSRVK